MAMFLLAGIRGLIWLTMYRRDLIQIKNIAIGIGNQCHESAPWLPGGRHGELNSEFCQSCVLGLEIGNFQADAGMPTNQFSLFWPRKRDSQANAAGCKGRIAVLLRGELEIEPQLVPKEFCGPGEITDKNIDVCNLHDSYSP